MKVLVWDVPTRLFHWLFAGSFAVAFLTAESESLLVVHIFAGLLMLFLVGFRIIWGVVGSRYACFSSFMYSPSEAFRYVLDVFKGGARRYIGHNPAGSWAIYALLAFGLFVTVSGLALVAGGEVFEEPHEALSFAMLALVVVHVIGVVVESLAHRENLTRAMIDGHKQGSPEEGIPSHRYWAGLVMVVLLAVFSYAFFTKHYDASRGTLDLPIVGKTLDLKQGGEGGHEHEDD